MTINRSAIKAGLKYQRDLMSYLRDTLGLDAERLVLTGAEDEGDVLLRLDDRRIVLEAKRERGFSLAGWVDEAVAEAQNYKLHRSLNYDPFWAVVHHARGKSMGRSYVTLELDEYLRQIR